VKSYITPKQYYKLNKVLRDKLSARLKVFCGTIVEKNNKILLVKESNDKDTYDIPGGKLMWGESLQSCAEREFLEESGYTIKLTNLVGIYQREVDVDENDYIRFIFKGKLCSIKTENIIDTTVIDASWFNKIDLVNKVKFRSEELKTEITDYLNGNSYPIDIIHLYKW
jgi:ADP-ribose pyrophosphatase YjhB (NUDIX family)